MERVGATPEQLRQFVESRHGGIATALYVVPVRQLAGDLLWEGEVHVFHLLMRQGRAEAFAWSCPFDGALHSRLQSELVPGPVEAVRADLQARGWLGSVDGHAASGGVTSG